MKFTVQIPANEHEQFASDAFDHVIGSKTNMLGEEGAVLEAVVANDGHSVDVTIEVPDSGHIAYVMNRFSGDYNFRIRDGYPVMTHIPFTSAATSRPDDD